MKRPNCTRCGNPLDLMPDFDEPGRWRLYCNNLHKQCTPMQDDEAFDRAWENLPGDEVVRLEKLLEGRA